MKKIYIFLVLAYAPFFAFAEGGCSVQVQVQNVDCFGNCSGQAMAFPTGSSPFIYNWLPSGQTTPTVTNLCPGSYTVIVTDANNCTSTATFNVVEPPLLQVSTSATNESCSGCCDGFIVSTATGGIPAYTYLWSTSPPQNTSTAQALCSGTYTLCVTDVNGCTTCDASTVNFTTGITEQSLNAELAVFPVPATEFVNVSENFTSPLTAVISITNVLGETLYSKSLTDVSGLNETINIAAFAKGVYFVAVKTSLGYSVKRIVKE
ncbi:MAG: T9SS type A sorting domain-containing protein [Bacteroidia bacterium]